MSRRGAFSNGWRVYCALAGGGDTLTGVLLMTAPILTLRLMGIEPPAADPVFLRFIGAFVTGVGLCYGLPFVKPGGAGAEDLARERLVTIFDATALVRFSVAALLTVALLRGDLAPAWRTVAVTDFLLGGFQVFARVFLLRRETGRG
ncbi:MAG: hypothetical protein KDD47_18725 [Acidobacteria bacterium]|nr:hypothetical protein [Acidobacteriota bacterium]